MILNEETPVKQKKHEPTKLELLEGALKDAEKVRKVIKSKWEKDRRVLRDSRKESIQGSLAERSADLKKLNKEADSKKKPHKAIHDTLRTAAKEYYEERSGNATKALEKKLVEITEELNAELEKARVERRDSYNKVNEELRVESEPILQKHKDTVHTIEAGFEKEMKTVDETEETDIEKLSKKINDINAEIDEIDPSISTPAAGAA